MHTQQQEQKTVATIFKKNECENTCAICDLAIQKKATTQCAVIYEGPASCELAKQNQRQRNRSETKCELVIQNQRKTRFWRKFSPVGKFPIGTAPRPRASFLHTCRCFFESNAFG